MTLDDLPALDWARFSDASTAEWAKLLDALLALAPQAKSPAQRGVLADALDTYASHSSSPDFDTIIKLDRVARRSARALREANIDAALAELDAASGEFKAITKEIGAVAKSLQKEAAVLRAERLHTAVTSLTDTIASLKSVSQSLNDTDDTKLAAALAQAVASAQKLRGLIEQGS